MPRSEIRKASARRRPSPIVEMLEGRQLLNATAVTHPAAQVHAEVVKSTHSSTALVHEKVVATKSTHHEKVTALKTKSTHQPKVATTKTVHPAKSAAKSPVHAAVVAKGKTTVVKNKFFTLTRTQGIANPTSSSKQVTYSPVVGAYTPAQIQKAYGVDLLGLANQGQGVTIAIVDEFDDQNIIGDANVYSAYYNLPIFNSTGGPTLSVLLDNHLGTVTTAAGTGVGGETSLDVEVAHAMAPKANIILVEVPATGTVANEFKQLLEGVQYAAQQPGVVAVSLSYGYPEGNIGAANVTSQNATYLATGAASNLAVTVSTGDGSTPLFPATSPNVLAVGGTSLYLDSAQGDYGYETAWGGLAGAGAGGGGLSTNFAAPTFQSNNNVTFAKRAIPDISLVADPVTAVSIYDSLDVTTSAPSPWGATGGTSVAAPLFGGIVALAQQDRLAAFQPLLTSVQIDGAIYSAYNSPQYANYFTDVTLGSNKNVNSSNRTTVTGFTAKTGYDEATGVGSPFVYTLVPYLAGL